MKPTTAIIVLLLVASLSVVGCTNTTTHQLNQSTESAPATNSGIEVVVKAMQSPSRIGTETPRSVYRFVAYNTTVKNVDAPNRVITRNYFSLQDTMSRNYNMSGLSDSLGPFNWSSHSQPGDALGGIVVFEVPQNATLKSLTYFDGTTKIVTTL
jgi:hypothetical protein